MGINLNFYIQNNFYIDKLTANFQFCFNIAVRC